ncbi:helix-turn-helix domain-containing protein [Actinomadura chibensis]|nr:helix-turn-helix transcriptional regulator [Actinomadura chibensis]
MPPDRALTLELKRLKRESGLSFGRLAARTNYSASALERYVNGKALPPRGAVEALAEACGAAAGDLLELLDAARHANDQKAESQPEPAKHPLPSSELRRECERLARAVIERESRVRHDLLRGFTAPSVAFEAAGVWRGGGPGTAGPAAGTGGDLRSIGAFFAALPSGRLVIVGEPDSGKTLLAVELVLGAAAPLADPAAESPAFPVVALRLRAGDRRPGRGLGAWLAGHLAAELNTDPDVAAELVAARHVLPVVDGLDRLDPAPAAALLAELDRWADVTGTRAGAVVVTCADDLAARLEEEGVPLEGAVKIRVRPLRTTRIRTFLRRRIPDGHPAAGPRDALLAMVRAAPGKAAGLRRPWRLALVAAALSAGAADAPRTEHDLLRVQIDLATRAAGRPGYDPERVLAWLVAIAARLGRDGADTIVPSRLWRTAGPWRFGLTVLAVALPAAAPAGAISGSWTASAAAAAAVAVGTLAVPPVRRRTGLLAAAWSGLLPWRLTRFLRWCRDAGLLNAKGKAFQFRHRELLDHPQDRP